jgi:hypothetical protein
MKNQRPPLAAALFAALFLFAPGHPVLSHPTFDAESSAQTELLALHQADRRAHFTRDAEALVAALPEKFIYVRDGKITTQSKDDARRKFEDYFRGAEFSSWDDLEPPVVRVSSDGTTGWMIVRVKVALTKTDAAGKRTPEQFVAAWMSAYEKRDGKWFHVANTSTFEP